jgi:peptide subunit release factor 1 (eRF1)
MNHKKLEPCPQDKTHLCIIIYGSRECRGCGILEKAFTKCHETQEVQQCDECAIYEDCCDYSDDVEQEADSIYADEQEMGKQP